MVDALTTANAMRRAQLLRWMLASQCGNGLMHESIDVTDEASALHGKHHLRCTTQHFKSALSADAMRSLVLNSASSSVVTDKHSFCAEQWAVHAAVV